MDRRSFLRSSLAVVSLPVLGHVALAASPLDREPEVAENRRTAWFRAAKFGMFIHWGPYSVSSVEAPWPIMQPGHWGISEAEYRALPARFNPVQYDPDHFIDLARTAGQKYMVFTTKHHDGFCMFDSATRATKSPTRRTERTSSNDWLTHAPAVTCRSVSTTRHRT